MNRNMMKSFAIAIVLPAALAFSGCLRGASAAKELAEDAVAEALVTQSISSYNEVALNVQVNDRGVEMACNSGGTVNWEALESTGEICYEVDSRGCDFETNGGRAFTIEGTSSMCGADDFEITESALTTDQSYTLSGSATVSNADGERTCNYDLAVSIDQVLGNGAQYDVSVTGSLCGSRVYAGSFQISVEGNVEVDASAE